jgi:ribosome biogenesis GTPase A
MMKNNIIIAGVPRAGKSTMSNILSRRFGYQHVSMDAIIAGIESVFPKIGIKWWPSSEDESENMKRFYNASEKVALFIAAMLKSEEYDEFEPGMVADVYQLLPEHYIKYLNGQNIGIAYFLTADVTVEERFAIHRKYDTEKHYTFDFSDEDMLSHCTFVIKRSQFLREQCLEYGLPYHETAKNRENVFEQFIQSLKK